MLQDLVEQKSHWVGASGTEYDFLQVPMKDPFIGTDEDLKKILVFWTPSRRFLDTWAQKTLHLLELVQCSTSERKHIADKVALKV